MAQQTQIATMVPFWARWMQRFPTIAALAAASEDDVRSAWAGLGYYRRAANLRKGAQYLVAEHRGELPTTSAGLCDVPGIGPYTAGAVASICFREVVPAVDGNVIRVLCRVAAAPGVDPKTPQANKWARATATQLIAGCRDPGAFNESLMELGATVCRPSGAPSCATCPLAAQCQAKALLDANAIAAIEGVFPEKSKGAAKLTAAMACAVHCVRSGGGGSGKEGGARSGSSKAGWELLLVQRPGSAGLLAGMYDFPSIRLAGGKDAALVPTPNAARQAVMRDLLLREGLLGGTTTGGSGSRQRQLFLEVCYAGTVRHIFSHIDMCLSCFVVEWPSRAALDAAAAAMVAAGCLRVAAVSAPAAASAGGSKDASGSDAGSEEGGDSSDDGPPARKRARREAATKSGKAQATPAAPATVFRIAAVDTLDKQKDMPLSRLVQKAIDCAGLRGK